MIRVGIIGGMQEERKIYQILHKMKEVESVGLYNPEKDFNSEKFKIYHNPIELLELSDAILICNAERISSDFIRLMIRKSRHIYFKQLPSLSITDLSELLKLQKEADSIVHLYNPLLAANPKIETNIKSGAKIINLQLAIKEIGSNLATVILWSLIYLCKIENATIKHSDVLALENTEGQISVNIHNACSNGSIHNIILSDQSTRSDIQIFQKHKYIEFDFIENSKNNLSGISPDDYAFQNFINATAAENHQNTSLEDLYNCQKSYIDIKEKLNYSGINI